MKEAMTAASELVAEADRHSFLVIGGPAMIRYGSERTTRDVDIETLGMFTEKARMDHRFREGPDGSWTCKCREEGIEGFDVPLEFLEIGGGFIPKLHGMMKSGPVCVASLADMVLMKALTYQDRAETKALLIQME